MAPFLPDRKKLCNFSRGHHKENVCEIIFQFRPIMAIVQEKILIKDISYLELWWSLCSVIKNHLSRNMGFPTMWYV